ncbi:protein of unknown function [Methylocaldum szegediense]|uniref:Uncharacterized protein n=1 Tax=Methylocaldum szegediense TaxID=73780 RepID=A0ABM9HX92_9GAMM|nr:protein of unknown function [Methylocaldum szegediense]
MNSNIRTQTQRILLLRRAEFVIGYLSTLFYFAWPSFECDEYPQFP